MQSLAKTSRDNDCPHVQDRHSEQAAFTVILSVLRCPVYRNDDAALLSSFKRQI